MKSYGVTIQMNPFRQYLHMALFVLKNVTRWDFGFALNFEFSYSWE